MAHVRRAPQVAALQLSGHHCALDRLYCHTCLSVFLLPFCRANFLVPRIVRPPFRQSGMVIHGCSRAASMPTGPLSLSLNWWQRLGLSDQRLQWPPGVSSPIGQSWSRWDAWPLPVVLAWRVAVERSLVRRIEYALSPSLRVVRRPRGRASPPLRSDWFRGGRPARHCRELLRTLPGFLADGISCLQCLEFGPDAQS